MIWIIFENVIFFAVGYLVFQSYLGQLMHFNNFICILITFSISCSILFEVTVHVFWNGEHYMEKDVPVILWWTRSIGNRNVIRKCYNRECLITHNRSVRDTNVSKVIAFYGSDIDIMDLPLPRENAIWALLHEESPKNTPILMNDDFFMLFNFTSTFSRFSHFPLHAMHLNDLHDIKNLKYYVPTDNKSTLLKKGMAPVLYIQSDCDTLNDRDSYVAELSKYIKVDSYGRCLNNAELPNNLKNESNIYSENLLRFVAQYQFTIAIENAVCDDYITEKLWRPLLVGSIPIYFGSPTIRDWLPNYDGAILISDFEEPKKLAEFLKNTAAKNDFYKHAVAHKIDGIVSNEMLINILKSRRWKWYADTVQYENFVDEFECQLCLYLYGDIEVKRKTDRSHYKCSYPHSVLTNKKNYSNHWNEILRYANCQGRAVYEFISENISYTKIAVHNKVEEMLSKKEC